MILFSQKTFSLTLLTFQEERCEWILKGNISNYNSAETNGLSQKTISEDDFARWNRNIDLLEKAFDDIINIWNLISYINWNEESQFEWEDR